MPRSAPTSLSLLPSAAGLPELLYRFLLLLLLASVMPDFGRPYREYPLAFPHPSSKLVHGRLLAGFHAVGSKEGISQGHFNWMLMLNAGGLQSWVGVVSSGTRFLAGL